MSFNKLNLSPWVLRLCQKIRYNTPTPIQSLAIPPILQGKSIIGNAQTGSGKTATFALPILNRLAKQPYSIFSIIIAPSRQLAIQISQQFSIFGQSINLRQALIIGGVNYNKQIQQLQNYPHIVIGTPGRICDLLAKCQRFKQDIKRTQIMVLDQADRLFQETLLPNMKQIILSIQDLNQIILTTATIDQNFQGKRLKELLQLDNNQNNKSKIGQFIKYSTYQQKKTVKTLIQKYVFTPQQLKPGYLIQYLKNNPKHKIIIFVKTCKQCTIICQTLKQLDFEAVTLHSFMKSQQRMASLGMFRSDTVRILVTTDLTSRGLDINNVNMVINYNVPRLISDYIHRVGRTARNGYQGQAITFVTQYQVQMFLQIQKQVGVKMQEDKEVKQDLQLVSKFNKTRRQVKIRLMSQGILDQLDKRSKNKKEFKQEMKKKNLQFQTIKKKKIIQEIQEK